MLSPKGAAMPIDQATLAIAVLLERLRLLSIELISTFCGGQGRGDEGDYV